MDDLPPVVIIAGPTASGKTDTALDVAERLEGEIVNADSMQVYRGIDVLAAMPSPEEQARVRHHLFGVLDVSERCSAGRWLDMAAAALADIHARGKLPIVVGGTGLYLKVLMHGIAPMPDVPAETITSLEARFADIGGDAFKAELATVDPVTAAKFPASDRQRLIRAAAVFATTGRAISDWHNDQPDAPGYAARYCVVLFAPPRDELYDRINARFDDMLAHGAMTEAEAFADLGIDPSLPAARAVGVAELVAVAHGELPFEAAVEKAKTSSRNLAKRQFTWFSRQIHKDLIVDEKFSERDSEKIFSFIRQFVLTEA